MAAAGLVHQRIGWAALNEKVGVGGFQHVHAAGGEALDLGHRHGGEAGIVVLDGDGVGLGERQPVTARGTAPG